MRFYFRTPDVMGRSIYKRGIREADLTHFLLDTLIPELALSEGDVILDVGANLGWNGVLFDRATPPGVHIYCFEPDPVNFEILSSNIALNGCEKVTCEAIGASAQDGTATLYVYPDKNTGKHSMVQNPKGAALEVPVRRLDSYLQEKGIAPLAVKLIKIDVEGYEPVALKGMESILAAGPVVMSELVPRYMERGGLSMADYLAFMGRFGYEPFLLDGPGLKEASHSALAGITGNADLFWKREDVQ
jgi:FkbM family methyltransferase